MTNISEEIKHEIDTDPFPRKLPLNERRVDLLIERRQNAGEERVRGLRSLIDQKGETKAFLKSSASIFKDMVVKKLLGETVEALTRGVISPNKGNDGALLLTEIPKFFLLTEKGWVMSGILADYAPNIVMVGFDEEHAWSAGALFCGDGKVEKVCAPCTRVGSYASDEDIAALIKRMDKEGNPVVAITRMFNLASDRKASTMRKILSNFLKDEIMAKPDEDLDALLTVDSTLYAILTQSVHDDGKVRLEVLNRANIMHNETNSTLTQFCLTMDDEGEEKVGPPEWDDLGNCNPGAFQGGDSGVVEEFFKTTGINPYLNLSNNLQMIARKARRKTALKG